MENYEQMTVSERIKTLIKKKYFSQVRLATLMDVTPPTISEHLRKQGDLPSKYLSTIRSEFPNISADWLLTGKGEIEDSLIEFIRPSDKRVDEQSVPLYDFEAAAGLTKLFSNSENILDFIRVPNLPKCDGAVHISGDSMYPLLKSGDIVMYKQVQDKTGILWGEMYLLSAEIGGDVLTLVKYIQRSDLGLEYVKLVSQNQYHAPIDVHIDKVRALAYIKASIRINSMA